MRRPSLPGRDVLSCLTQSPAVLFGCWPLIPGRSTISGCHSFFPFTGSYSLAVRHHPSNTTGLDLTHSQSQRACSDKNPDRHPTQVQSLATLVCALSVVSRLRVLFICHSPTRGWTAGSQPPKGPEISLLPQRWPGLCDP